MARKTDDNHKPEVLIGIVKRYFIEKEPVKKPKYSELGAYARSIGYDIGNHIFQKCPEVREYLENASKTNDDETLLTVAVFDTLDTERFLAVNNTPSKLKKALQERDAYYRNVSSSAGKIFEKNKALTDQVVKLKERNKAVEAENKGLKEKISEITSEYRQLQEKEKKMRDIMDTWVYPEMANELLKKEGLLKDTAGIIKEEAVKKEVLDSGSDIGGLISSMFKMVDKD